MAKKIIDLRPRRRSNALHKDLTPDHVEEIKKLMASGKSLSAIRVIRSITGMAYLPAQQELGKIIQADEESDNDVNELIARAKNVLSKASTNLNIHPDDADEVYAARASWLCNEGPLILDVVEQLVAGVFVKNLRFGKTVFITPKE